MKTFALLWLLTLLSPTRIAVAGENPGYQEGAAEAEASTSLSRSDILDRYSTQLPKRIVSDGGRLRKLALRHADFTDPITAVLFPAESIEDFRVCSTDVGISRFGLRRVLKCTNLRTLMIATRLELDAATMELVGELEKLRELALVGARLDADGIRYLAMLSELQSLTLCESNLTDEMLNQLAPLRIVTLDVTGTDVTPQGLLAFEGHPTLKSIVVTDSNEIPESVKTRLLGIDFPDPENALMEILSPEYSKGREVPKQSVDTKQSRKTELRTPENE